MTSQAWLCGNMFPFFQGETSLQSFWVRWKVPRVLRGCQAHHESFHQSLSSLGWHLGVPRAPGFWESRVYLQ